MKAYIKYHELWSEDDEGDEDEEDEDDDDNGGYEEHGDIWCKTTRFDVQLSHELIST